MSRTDDITIRHFLIAAFQLSQKFLRNGKKRTIETFPQGLGQVGPFLRGKRQRQITNLGGAHKPILIPPSRASMRNQSQQTPPNSVNLENSVIPSKFPSGT